MCGIVAVADSPQAAQLAHLGLFALQHRGQESAGIVSAYRSELRPHVGMGLVSEVFTRAALQALTGEMAIGHVRYSTTGASQLKNAQPLLFKTVHGPMAIAHNGNLTNAARLRRSL